MSNTSGAIAIDKLSQLEFINRYKSDDQSAIDEWMVGYPLIGQCVALYTYAQHTGERQLNQLADELLDDVKKWNHSRQLLVEKSLPVTYIFDVLSLDDCQQAEELVEQFQIENYRLNPVYP